MEVPEVSTAPTVRACSLRAQYRPDALGIGTGTPGLGWTSETNRPDWHQQRYQLRCEAAAGVVDGDVVVSAESAFVAWPFAPLRSRERVVVRVRVWGEDGSASDWSEPLPVEAGLLDEADWSARFITPAWDQDTAASQPGPLLRREFSVRPGLAQARLYVTACGCYEASLNGQRVGDEVLAPGWTSYHHRLRYQTHDVTPLLREGRNALGALLGDGWFLSRLGLIPGRRNQWGERLALLAQLELAYADGSTERIVSDASWQAGTGGLRNTEIWDGETYDAQLEPEGWQQPGFDARGWHGVRLLDRRLDTLVAPDGPPMRRVQTVQPVEILVSPSGRTILDFGQNLVGWLRLRVTGPRGRRIVLRHAEVLQDGELCTAPLRGALNTDTYVLKGDGIETWEPRFTFHGFRFAEVSGWPGELALEDIEAVVVHSDLQRTGWFECSDPLVTQLHENAVWSMRGNFLDVPTDCPQRDERLGWTGDIQVFSPTAAYLYDVNGFLGSWLQCLAKEQAAKGVVPYVVPDCTGMPNAPSAAWGDAASIVPWVLYERSGDRFGLERQYPSMKAWVEQVGKIAGEAGLWDKGFQFGDWLDPTAPADNPAAAKTHPHVLATACLVRSARAVAQAAQVLDQAADAQRFMALAEHVQGAFRRQYVTPGGWIIGDSITSYCLALVFDLLEGEQREGAGRRLKALVAESGFHIATGFVGTPLLCDALVRAGGVDIAYKLLLQRECPSWLYPVLHGATTIWERWDSLLPDGRVNPSGMTSFNHYAFGAVADWLHRCVAGLSPARPGYRRLRIEPLPGGGLTWAKTRHRTPYGLAAVSWTHDGRTLVVDATVPPNTRAEVHLPGQPALTVGSGRHRWEVPFEIAVSGPSRITLDHTVAELMADEQAWDVYKATMIRLIPALAGFFENAHNRQSQQGMGAATMRETMGLVPNGEAATKALAEAFDDLNRSRGFE